MKNYCSYYTAFLNPSQTWFVTATLKYVDHLSLDRTVDVEQNLFEFFVHETQEEEFVRIMQEFIKQGLVTEFEKKPNRLLDPSQQV